MIKRLTIAAVTSLAVAGAVTCASAASASGAVRAGGAGCTGTLTSPGVLAGTYQGNVVVTGFCVVNGGPALVRGNLTLAPGAALNATFARNDVSGKGASSLTVNGNVTVLKGAVLGMGCEPNASPCSDDPNAGTGGTLTGKNHVRGNVTGRDALAVIMHASRVDGNVTQDGGGGGLSCDVPTTGIFSLLGSPVFSDYEDNTVRGNLSITSLKSCWMGALRNTVHGNLVNDGNTFADPDAEEATSNTVRGNISCFANTPAVQYGDAANGRPNRVSGSASGQCGFDVKEPNPAPAGPLTPISVRAH